MKDITLKKIIHPNKPITMLVAFIFFGSVWLIQDNHERKLNRKFFNRNCKVVTMTEYDYNFMSF